MKYRSILITLLFITTFNQIQGQSKLRITADTSFKAVYIGESRPLRSIKPRPLTRVEKGKKVLKEIPNFKGKKSTKRNRRNPNSKLDPLWDTQNSHMLRSLSAASSILNQEGQSFSNVTPPDPILDVGTNHVVQMINGALGSLMVVKDKQGKTIYGPANLSNLWEEFNLKGMGDPIVMYDRFAKRWFLSEFALSGNVLLMAISTEDDPLGSYYSYAVTTPNFPDYPKYSVWNNAYFCTTNEYAPVIYALEREAMLEGRDPVVQRFAIDYPSVYLFNALAPVSIDGKQLPPSSTPASFWRHVDDEAHSPASSISATDFLEYWELSVDFNNSANSELNGPFKVSVTDFDSDINGYFSFSGIRQPNAAISLDPLREVLMNRMQYRNFGDYQTIVASHVCDVNGHDRTGIRWYELRRQLGGNWQLYQEGTYAPTEESRWMSAISMDGQGNIALAYSVTSETTFPSLRYTGRLADDPLGQMTVKEQSIAEGKASNNNSRYGDYASMTIDPVNDTDFWFTGEYNPTAFWSTRIAAFSLIDLCQNFQARANANINIACDDQTDIAIETIVEGGKAPYTYSLNEIDFQSSAVFENVSAGEYQVTIQDANGCQIVTETLLIQEAPPLKLQTQNEMVSCFGNQDGQIIAQVEGGIPPFTYQLNDLPPQENPNFENLEAGTYFLTIKDASACPAIIDTIQLTQPELLEAQISIDSLSCTESQDGRITLFGQGGMQPLQYSLDGINYQSEASFENLGAGLYQLYVQDAQGCIYIKDSVEMEAANPLSFIYIVTPPGQETPNQGTVEVIAFGGDGNYQYSIDGIKFQESNLLEGLSAGTYEIFVKDSQGCQTQETIGILLSEPTIQDLNQLVDIYPNPTFDDFQLKFNGKFSAETLALKLIDSQGNLIRSEKMNPNQVIEPLEFSMKAHPRGVYFLVLSGDGRKTTFKIVYN